MHRNQQKEQQNVVGRKEMQNNTDSLMLLFGKPQVPSSQGNCILVWLFFSEKKQRKDAEEFRDIRQKQREALKCLHLETNWRRWDSSERKFKRSDLLKIFISSTLKVNEIPTTIKS